MDWLEFIFEMRFGVEVTVCGPVALDMMVIDELVRSREGGMSSVGAANQKAK